ncbi:MAG: glucose-6-phosphate isomerase, partial [Deltaproteobacteria bacterium]
MLRELEYEYQGILAEVIGKEQGLSDEEIFSYQSQADTAHQALKDLKETGEIGFMDLPEKVEEARAITEKAGELRQGVEACLVLGIGGSSLGGRALRDAIKTPLYNELPREKRDGFPRLYFAENIDPETFTQLLGVLNPARTLVVVISKSGGTAETMSQFLITMDW